MDVVRHIIDKQLDLVAMKQVRLSIGQYMNTLHSCRSQDEYFKLGNELENIDSDIEKLKKINS